ncbi:MAG: hypothetical protein ACRDOO_17655 [Actinomadura sp.]
MSWVFSFEVTDCSSGEAVPGATVHMYGYFIYEDQLPAESHTAIADSQGRLTLEARDDVIVVDALIGKSGHVAQLRRVARDAAGTTVEVCLPPASSSVPTRPPEALHVTGWGPNHVDLEWWNGDQYKNVLVGWTDTTGEPGVHHQLDDLSGSATTATIHTMLVPGHRYDLKAKGYGSAHGWSEWTIVPWTCPATGPIPDDAQTQDKWRWCEKCQGLIFADAAATSMSIEIVSGHSRSCNAGGVHRVLHSGAYEPFHGPQASSLVGRTQIGWKWCAGCSGLIYTGSGNGRCKKGGPHDVTGSGDYYLYYERNPVGTQGGWRWCNRCQALAFGEGLGGVCHDGQAHDFNGSANYSVVHFA